MPRAGGSILNTDGAADSLGRIAEDCKERAIRLNANFSRRKRIGVIRAGVVAALLAVVARGASTGQDEPARRIPEALRFAHGLFSQRKFDLAAEEYQRFLDTKPEPADEDDALFGLACARLFQGRYKDSRAAFQEFLRLAPNHSRARTAWYRLGELSYMLGDLPAAREALERVTADPAPHANLETAWIYLGDVRLGLDDPQAARTAYETALKQFPKSRLADRARYGLGRSLAALGETDAAIGALEELVDAGAADWLDKALLQIGKIEMGAGRFAQAEKALARLAEVAPQSALTAEAQLRRGEALARLDRPDDAADLLRPLAADPSQPLAMEAALGLAGVELRRQRPEEALGTLDAALEHAGESPLVPALLYRSGEALRALKRDAEARARFLKVAEANPADPWADDAWREAARLALEAGDHAEAAKLASAFPEKFPDSPLGPDVRLIQARAAMAQGEPKTAVEALESLVGTGGEAANPTASPELLNKARYELALAYRADGRGDRADALLAELAKGSDKEVAPDSAFLLGQDHLEAGRFAEALADLKRYLEAAPDGRVADYALAHESAAHLGLGQRDEAAEAVNQLAERFPKSAALPPARLRLAEADAEAGESTRAIVQFRALIDATEPAPPQDLKERAELGLARALAKSGDPAAAEPLFDAVIARAKTDAEASSLALERARAFEAAGKAKEAGALFEKVANAYPKENSALFADLARARLLDAADPPNPAAAAEILGKLLADQETRARLEAIGQPVDALLAEWGWTLADAGKTDEADAAFKELLEAFPNGPHAADARFNLAESANQRRDFAEVVKLLAPMVDAQDANANAPPVPDRLLPDILYRLGRTRIELGEWPAAVKPLDRLINEFPKGDHLREARFLRAEAALRLDQFAEAEAGLSALDAEPPGPNDPPNFLSIVRERRLQALIGLSRWEDAIAEAERLKPMIAEVAARDPVEFSRGRALLGLGRVDEARAAFQAVIDARKAGDLAAQAQLMLGETYFHEDRFREALKEFLKVDILYDAPRRQAAALLEAGKVYERLNQWTEAAETYNRLTTRFPDDPLAAEAKDRRAAAIAKQDDAKGKQD